MDVVYAPNSLASEILIFAWTAFFGGCVGSFLNVVIYRVPLGKSVVYPGSACPKCGHAIRWYHNLPIIGWVMLGGKCYDCRSPISARYPIVEAIVSALFLFCAWADAGLGMMPKEVHRFLPAEEPWTLGLWLLAFYHAILLTLLVMIALMEFDARRGGEGRPPVKIILVAILLALIPQTLEIGFMASSLRLPEPTDATPLWSPRWPAIQVVASIVIAGALAYLLGSLWTGPTDRSRLRAYASLAILLIGAFLGSVAVTIIALLVAMVIALQRAFSPFRSTWPACWLTIATIAWIGVWPWIELAYVQWFTRNHASFRIGIVGLLVAALLGAWGMYRRTRSAIRLMGDNVD